MKYFDMDPDKYWAHIIIYHRGSMELTGQTSVLYLLNVLILFFYAPNIANLVFLRIVPKIAF